MRAKDRQADRKKETNRDIHTKLWREIPEKWK